MVNKRMKLMAVAIAAVTMATSSGIVYADDLSDAKEKSATLEEQINNQKSEIDEMKNNKEDILKEVSALDNEMSELNNTVNSLNSQISQSTEKIQELEKKSEELQAEAEKSRDLMNKRFRVLYQNNGSAYIDILLSADGFGDFLQKLDTVATLIKYNNEVIQEYKDNYKELETTLAQVNDEKESLETSKASVDANISELQVKMDQKQQLVAEAESDIQSAQAVLAQSQDDFDKVLASINSMEEAASRPSRGDTSSGTSSGSVSTNGFYRISSQRYPITSGFVDRISPITGQAESHKGIDIGAPYGDPVYALTDGVVSYAGWMNGYGNVVVINHGSFSTLYAHNSSLVVSPGQSVSGGQQVSVVGSTGWSTGPHIHFEVIIDGVQIDPSGYYM